MVRPGGTLVIFEDEPGNAPPEVQNYRDVQSFLAQLVRPNRGPLLSGKQFQKLTSGSSGTSFWEIELEANSLVADPDVVLGFLAGSSGVVTPEVAELMNRIKRHGLAYGNFWWARWEKAANNA